MKKILKFLLVSALLLACGPKDTEMEKEKFTKTFYGTFDTVVSMVAYTEDEEEFDYYFNLLEDFFNEYHKYFDNYHEYSNLNNIMSINNKAGEGPVEVNQEIIDLLLLSKEYYENISTNTDISYGALFEIWHNYREDKENPRLPEISELEEGALHSGMDKIKIDEINKTVEFTDPNLKIDLGAIAKGYTTEMAGRFLEEEGLKSAIINGGGDIKIIGKPADERENWAVSVQNPDYLLGLSNEESLETLIVNDISIVTSGDYQRFYEVDGVKYHHIVDIDTLFPGDLYRSVTVMADNTALADFLATALYNMELEEGKILVDSFDNVEVLWLLNNGEKVLTEGMGAVAYSESGGNR